MPPWKLVCILWQESLERKNLDFSSLRGAFQQIASYQTPSGKGSLKPHLCHWNHCLASPGCVPLSCQLLSLYKKESSQGPIPTSRCGPSTRDTLYVWRCMFGSTRRLTTCWQWNWAPTKMPALYYCVSWICKIAAMPSSCQHHRIPLFTHSFCKHDFTHPFLWFGLCSESFCYITNWSELWFLGLG